MAVLLPSALGLELSWANFSREWLAATPMERSTHAPHLRQLLAQQASEEDRAPPPELFTLRRMVVRELEAISAQPECAVVWAELQQAMSHMQSGMLEIPELWRAHKLVQDACRAERVPQGLARRLGQLCREMLVIRVCCGTGAMDADPNQFRRLMSTSTAGVQDYNDELHSQLSLCYRTVVTIGCVEVAEGKHVKTTCEQLSVARTQGVAQGQRGRVLAFPAGNAIVKFDGVACAQWIPAEHVNHLRLCGGHGRLAAGKTVKVHTAFSVSFPDTMVPQQSEGTVLLAPAGGEALVRFQHGVVWMPSIILEVTDFPRAMTRLFGTQGGWNELQSLYGRCARHSPYRSKQQGKGRRFGTKRQPGAVTDTSSDEATTSSEQSTVLLDLSEDSDGVATQQSVEATASPPLMVRNTFYDLPGSKAESPLLARRAQSQDRSWRRLKGIPVNNLYVDPPRPSNEQKCSHCGKTSLCWKDRKATEANKYRCEDCYFYWQSPICFPSTSERWPGGPMCRYEKPNVLTEEPHEKLQIVIVSQCCLEVARDRRKHKPCLLVMGREKGPHSGLETHKYGQSRLIFQRTAIADAANYGLKDARATPVLGCMYLPGVQVPDSQTPWRLDMVYAAVPKMEVECDEYFEEAETKIRSVLRAARLEGHRELILGAWGCGFPQAPPARMAAIFKKLLLEDSELKGRFNRVYFPILPNSRHNALEEFRHAFADCMQAVDV